MALEVNLERAAPEGVHRFRCTAPAHGLHARHELARVEWLDHIVVGAGIEESGYVGLGIADRHDDDRNHAPGAYRGEYDDTLARALGTPKTAVAICTAMILRLSPLVAAMKRSAFFMPASARTSLSTGEPSTMRPSKPSPTRRRSAPTSTTTTSFPLADNARATPEPSRPQPAIITYMHQNHSRKARLGHKGGPPGP